jgi:hypothetical protein
MRLCRRGLIIPRFPIYSGKPPWLPQLSGRDLWESFVNRRPIVVTLIAWLLIAAGVLAFSVHLRELVARKTFHIEEIWIPMFGFLPVVSGIFILRGHGWARWLALVWMASLVAASFFDSGQKGAVHVVLFVVIAYSLFGGDGKAYFQPAKQASTYSRH